jgi:adenosylhomocysteine nucleosidase
MRRIAIVAALPGELRPLVRGWEPARRAGLRLWRRRAGESEWVAACAGMGAAAALRALGAIEADGPATDVVSAGWAGAVRPAFAAGKAYWASGVVDAGTGERFAASGAGEVWLVTASRVAGRAEKARLARAFDAGLVDMEAAGLARVCARRGIAFRAIKGVSDGPSDLLPDFSRFVTAEGRFQLFRFTLFALGRPRSWPTLVRMGRASDEAARSIARALIAFLDREGASPSR